MTSYSQLACPTAVGSPETVGINFGAYPRCEDGFVIKLGIYRRPVELPDLLHRVTEGEQQVPDEMEKRTGVGRCGM